MENPKISIIIPCYGVEKYLDRCMESVICQSLKDIEIILVDDCSPDHVPQICDKWAEKDHRIKVIHKEKNEGLGFARNTGLDIATGEYVAFIDSDDYVDKTMYKTLYEATEQGKMDAVYCGLRQECIDGKFLLINDFNSVKKFNKEILSKVAFSFINKTEICNKERFFMSVWHCLYKRELINKYHIKFYSEREVLSEDLPFQVEFCLKAERIKFIPDYLYTYCFNQNSLSRNFQINKFYAAFKLRDLLLNITKDYQKEHSLIDSEFYTRIRNLLTSLVFSKNYSIKEKYHYINLLCNNMIWNTLDISVDAKKSWKYKKPYQLLKANAPVSLIAFVVFDKLINRRTFFKHKYKSAIKK